MLFCAHIETAPRRGRLRLLAATLALAAGAACGRSRATPANPPAAPPAWHSLGRGADYAAIALSPKSAMGDGLLHVVRVDPAQATLRLREASPLGSAARTAAAWCDGSRIAAVINAGMYGRDLSSHVGFLRAGDRVANPRWQSSYQSILLLGARRPRLPGATIRDARSDSTAADFDDYDTVIQNLRLIRDPGENVWEQSRKSWSEAAIALDRAGRILFLFCRSPLTMHDFNELVLGLPLGVTRAMHVEGGPEASLSVRGPGLSVDLAGSYETGFNAGDGNVEQFPLPNVIAVEVDPETPGSQ